MHTNKPYPMAGFNYYMGALDPQWTERDIERYAPFRGEGSRAWKKRITKAGVQAVTRMAATHIRKPSDLWRGATITPSRIHKFLYSRAYNTTAIPPAGAKPPTATLPTIPTRVPDMVQPPPAPPLTPPFPPSELKPAPEVIMAPEITYQDPVIERADIAAQLTTEVIPIEKIAAIELEPEEKKFPILLIAAAAGLFFFFRKKR